MRWGAAAVLAVVIGAGVAVRHVIAHGELDQRLAEPTNCSVENFPLTFDVAETPRQEFVPAGSQLSSVQVCVGSTEPLGTTLTVVVREGNAAEPGDVIGEKSVPVSPVEAWPGHADYNPPVRLKPGDTYVLEVRSEGGVFWRGTAEDRYCAGAPNVSAGDLAFATYDSIRGSPAVRNCGGESTSSPWPWVLGSAGAALVVLAATVVIATRSRRNATDFQRSGASV